MIARKSKRRRLSLDLDGPQGNAYVLLGVAQKLQRELKLEADAVFEMQQGDYINLLKVFEKYFGDYVILETNQDELIEALDQ